MIESLFINIAASMIWFLLGVLVAWLYRLLSLKKPHKKLWKISDPQNLIICVATSASVSTGDYTRPTTGIGQLRAFGQVLESLNIAYNIKIQNILLSQDQIQRQIQNDLILLGGPKNNEITKEFLAKIQEHGILSQEGSKICWKKDTNFEYIGETDSETKKVKVDYGIAIRMKNPYGVNNNTYISLFAGCHTYGTIAAAEHFTKTHIKKMRIFKKHYDNIFIIVKCDVKDGFPVCIEEKHRYEF